jgi:uracil-DNA glycosylase
MHSGASLVELLPQKWSDLLGDSIELLAEIDLQISACEINPARGNIFKALSIEPSQVKVIILGQDPYPDRRLATGLAFSIPPEISKFPPTLRNIFTEYETDLGFARPRSGDLTPWIGEGVLLLNTILTCSSGESLSHAEIGWERFTRDLLSRLITPSTAGILWGSRAHEYSQYFHEGSLVQSSHPSPLSAYRGFFGSKPFTRTNEILATKGIAPIDWSLQSA